MSSLSPINPSAAQNNTLSLPANMQTGAQNNLFAGIGGLSGANNLTSRPGQANQFFNNQAFSPYASGYQQGAGQAAQMGQTAASNQYQVGSTLESWAPQLQQMGNQTYQTALDPLNDVYNKYFQQSQQQWNAQNAASGVGATPYGAGMNDWNISNFNTDWRAQMLNNQIAGLNAASGAYGQAANIGNMGASLQAGAAPLFMQSAQYPYQASQEIAGQQQQALQTLQQYGINTQNLSQQQIQDYLSLLGLQPAFQSAQTGSALAQSQIQSTDMSQIMKAIGGGAAFLGVPATGGASMLTGLGGMFGPQNATGAMQPSGMGGWGPM